MDSSEEQSRNTDLPRIESLEPDSNVKFARFAQLAKHESQILSIEEGIQIDSSDEQFENADSPRIEIVEPRSNVKIERPV
jgi:hypothetical protein